MVGIMLCSGWNQVVVEIVLWLESCCGWNHIVVGIMLNSGWNHGVVGIMVWSESCCGHLNYEVGFKTKTPEFFFYRFLSRLMSRTKMYRCLDPS